MLIKTTKMIFISAVIASLVGCQSAPKRDPEYAAVMPEVAAPAPMATGAIFQSGYEKSWFEDLRARRVGDILTVVLAESFDGEHKNEGKVEKSNVTSLTNPTLFGGAASLNGVSLIDSLGSTLTGGTGNDLGFNLTSNSAFSGKADNKQESTLNGSVTVTVVDVLPNGYLKIRGEKRIGLEGGNEYIKLSGIVRPVDIDTTNSVSSTKIADATLIYKGDGQVSSSTVMGWIAKFFISALSPF